MIKRHYSRIKRIMAGGVEVQYMRLDELQDILCALLHLHSEGKYIQEELVPDEIAAVCGNALRYCETLKKVRENVDTALDALDTVQDMLTEL